jgi:branched-subunit amino acid transport protein AzlD
MRQIILSVVLALHMLQPTLAMASANVKSPLSYSLQEYGVVLGISMMGGLVRFILALRRGTMLSLSMLIGELATSAFVGFLTFWACEAMEMNPLLTACTVGMAGHIGAKTLTWAEIAGRRFIERRFGVRFEETGPAALGDR